MLNSIIKRRWAFSIFLFYLLLFLWSSPLSSSGCSVAVRHILKNSSSCVCILFSYVRNLRGYCWGSHGIFYHPSAISCTLRAGKPMISIPIHKPNDCQIWIFLWVSHPNIYPPIKSFFLLSLKIIKIDMSKRTHQLLAKLLPHCVSFSMNGRHLSTQLPTPCPWHLTFFCLLNTSPTFSVPCPKNWNSHIFPSSHSQFWPIWSPIELL